MRVNDVSKSIAPRPLDDAQRLSSNELRALFVGFDLGFLPARGELCSLLGRVANAVAVFFEPEPSSGIGSIVDFGDGRNRARPGNKSIVDFGDRPASIVDFGDGRVRTD